MYDAEGKSYLYGTDIDDARVTKDFHRFINDYRVPEAPAGQRSHYHQQLLEFWEDQTAVRARGIKFPISGQHIAAFNKSLYTNLINFPTEVIPIFDRELWRIVVELMQADPEDLLNCQVQIHQLEDVDQRIMRQMNPMVDIERLVAIKGIVIRCSDLVPDMQTGLFSCTECKHEVQVPLSHWTIDEPTVCEACNKKHTFQVVHNDCSFGDRQLLKLQETPELVPAGETPHSVVVHCYDDLVDHVRPGDRIEITGIYRASAVRPMRNWSKCSAVYRTHVDAISIASESKGRIEQREDNKELYSAQNAPVPLAEEPDLNPDDNKPEDIEWNRRIRALAAETDDAGKRTIAQKLVQAFAPSIYEEQDVKKGLLCQLFGGTNKAPSKLSRAKCRPEINSLLCGDPSTAKSQLMQFSYKLAPRAVYTSGKGSSAVGLTASINKDPATKDLVLESGALVLADKGLCCIDEFDKMDENARAILHEAMEQQTVSVAKAGIVCSLNARTAILASANPKDSAYDPKKSVVENINLPKNLMTRFDLIWLMLDKRNSEMDRHLAEHLVSMYSESGAKKRKEPEISAEQFRRYVSFARRYVFPRLTQEASDKLTAEYMSLRNQGTSRDTITATPRNLESLIRLSESLAKMELREEVLEEDVAEASRLIKTATYAAMVDPETGLIDMEQLIAGVGAGRRRRQKELESLLEEVLAEKGSAAEGVPMDTVRAAMNERLGSNKEQLLREDEFMQAVRRLEDEGKCRRRGKVLERRQGS
jgi:DNA replication licensing factor MCM4